MSSGIGARANFSSPAITFSTRPMPKKEESIGSLPSPTSARRASIALANSLFGSPLAVTGTSHWCRQRTWASTSAGSTPSRGFRFPHASGPTWAAAFSASDTASSSADCALRDAPPRTSARRSSRRSPSSSPSSTRATVSAARPTSCTAVPMANSGASSSSMAKSWERLMKKASRVWTRKRSMRRTSRARVSAHSPVERLSR